MLKWPKLTTLECKTGQIKMREIGAHIFSGFGKLSKKPELPALDIFIKNIYEVYENIYINIHIWKCLYKYLYTKTILLIFIYVKFHKKYVYIEVCV